MSVSRAALLGLVDALAAAVDPAAVTIDDGRPNGAGEHPGDGDSPETVESGVRVRAAALSRVGRSQRDGAVLDLELVADVRSRGPKALELSEQILTALEREPRYTVEPDASGGLAGTGSGLGFQVRVPVGVRLDEPVQSRVSEPMVVDLRIARSLAGVLLDGAGDGVPDARVSAAVGGGASVTDPDGRFRVLVADAPRQSFVVEVRGATRTLDAATDTAPVVIRWE